MYDEVHINIYISIWLQSSEELGLNIVGLIFLLETYMDFMKLVCLPFYSLFGGLVHMNAHIHTTHDREQLGKSTVSFNHKRSV